MLNLIPLPYRVMALAGVLIVSNAVTAYRFYHTGYATAPGRRDAVVAGRCRVGQASTISTKLQPRRIP